MISERSRDKRSGRERWTRPSIRSKLAVGALAACAFAGSFGVVTAVGGLATPQDDEHTGGPATERTLVADGMAAGDIGAWRLWRSRDAEGNECLEVQILRDAHGAGPRVPEALPVPGGGTLGGGCAPDGFFPGSATLGDETLVYGPVPGDASELRVTGGRRLDRRVAPTASDDSERRFFAAAVPRSQTAGLRVSAIAGSGRVVAEADVPTPSD